MGYTYVKTAIEDVVGVVSLNNPPVNVLSTAVFKDVGAAIDEMAKNPAVRAIVLTGEGAVFAAGADIKEIAEIADAKRGEAVALEAQALVQKIENLDMPVICAVNGPCMGGGNELAMACHIRIASDRARFAQPEIKVGIIPGMGGTQRLPRLVGRAQALEMLLVGEPISATQAKAMGLVNLVVPEAELRRQAVGLGKRIGQNSKVMIAKTLKAVREGLPASLADGLKIEARLFGECMTAADKKEGVTAFVEKRPPKFTDR